MQQPTKSLQIGIQQVEDALLAKNLELSSLRIIDAYTMIFLLNALLHTDIEKVQMIQSNMDAHIVEFLEDDIVQYLDWIVEQPLPKQCKAIAQKSKKPKKS